MGGRSVTTTAAADYADAVAAIELMLAAAPDDRRAVLAGQISAKRNDPWPQHKQATSLRGKTGSSVDDKEYSRAAILGFFSAAPLLALITLSDASCGCGF